jgi:hypothetical protein
VANALVIGHVLGVNRAVLVAVIAACGTTAPPAARVAPPTTSNDQLLAPDAFAHIADRAERSRALFAEAGKVLTHARCVNCHPPDETPRQGDRHAIHDPPIVRGANDNGVAALQCTTCHQDRNAELARIPGAPGWHLAPLGMAWLGKSAAQICVQIKDPARNGGRTLAQVHDHVAHDGLVAWGWTPGADRLPAPGTQAELAALVQAWIDTGAE